MPVGGTVASMSGPARAEAWEPMLAIVERNINAVLAFAG